MADLSIAPPSPREGPHTLSKRINFATRATHSRLNKLILARFPLALPPYTTNPSIYVTGLFHIAPIYIKFESLWQSILDSPQPQNSERNNASGGSGYEGFLPDGKLYTPSNDLHLLAQTPQVSPKTRTLLSLLRLPGLLRSGRLRADIKALTGSSDHKIDQQIQAVSMDGNLAKFLAHISKTVAENPHVLLSYAWVLYMALFSGGRHLRAALEEAGRSITDFWSYETSPVRPYLVTQDVCMHEPTPIQNSTRSMSQHNHGFSSNAAGLQFFNFAGDEDGEDIKLEFKKILVEVEILLTSEEQENIITEARHIFDFMVEIVTELDGVIGTKSEDLGIAG